MYWLKQCTKCNGDLASGSDQYGPYVSCMQCGRFQDWDAMAVKSPVTTIKVIGRTAVAIVGGEQRGGYNPLSSPSKIPAALSA